MTMEIRTREMGHCKPLTRWREFGNRDNGNPHAGDGSPAERPNLIALDVTMEIRMWKMGHKRRKRL